MSSKKVIIIFLLTYGNFLFSNSLDSGLWFSEKKEYRNGFEFLQIFLQKDKFILAKLSYNEEKKWEETRVLGVIKENGKGKYRFNSEMCTVYATKKLGLRWILIKGFDCDHLEMQMTKKEQVIYISPSIGITDIAVLKEVTSASENSISAIIVSQEENKFQAWSLGMRYVKKGAAASLKGKSITILETVDSTGTFETNILFEAGDLIQIKNRIHSDFFE